VGRPERGANPDDHQQLTTEAPSLWPYPYSAYAQIYRVAKFRLGMDPVAVEALYWWQFKGLLGLDQPDGTGTGGSAVEQTRRAMTERADRLRRMVDDDPDTVAERTARAQSRKARRAQQRADPAWREEMVANRSRKRTADPSRVVQTGSEIDGIKGDIVIVR